MSDIRYKWNDGLNSVQISYDVSLPQFKVLGHRQKTIEASLSTGEINLSPTKSQLRLKGKFKYLEGKWENNGRQIMRNSIPKDA